MTPMTLDTEFVWAGEAGAVHAECEPNMDPKFWGCWHNTAQGFPICSASVDYPARGYRSMLGWVQLVRSTDNESAGTDFELDPFSVFGDAPSPYCWYGQRPTLFDAPSRPLRQALDWEAHSFLASTPLDEVAELKPRRVIPILGFCWGFTDDGSTVSLSGPAKLPVQTWDIHLELLRASYPWWHFSDSSGQ
jgi:hypothetical protein